MKWGVKYFYVPDRLRPVTDATQDLLRMVLAEVWQLGDYKTDGTRH